MGAEVLLVPSAFTKVTGGQLTAAQDWAVALLAETAGLRFNATAL
jgi:predicted amidohydrolase